MCQLNLLDESRVVLGSSARKVRVIGRARVGDGSVATSVAVAQIICECLEFVIS
jgi:hypothetical protein